MPKSKTRANTIETITLTIGTRKSYATVQYVIEEIVPQKEYVSCITSTELGVKHTFSISKDLLKRIINEMEQPEQ